MTNAEWIRTRPSKELAAWLMNIIHCPCCPRYEDGVCEDQDDGFCEYYLLTWLENDRTEQQGGHNG